MKKKKSTETEPNTADTVRVLRPAVDIQELADSYVVRLDIPGAEKESIAAQINKSTLTVSAKVQDRFKREIGIMFDGSLPSEYRREFALADDVETQTVDAAYELRSFENYAKKETAISSERNKD